MKKNIKNWLWVMVIGFVIIAMILVLTGCFGEKVAKAEETQATTKEASETTTEDTTQAAILAELKNLNKSIGDLKSSLSTEEATETTEVAATTEETTTEETTSKIVSKETAVETGDIQDMVAQKYFKSGGRWPGDDGGEPLLTVMESDESNINAPEGGVAYGAIGAVKLSIGDELLINLAWQERNVYQFYLIGRPSDKKANTDLNVTVRASDYKAGHGIFIIIPEGPVDEGWSLQQVVAGFEPPNCGADGCGKVTIVVIDLGTGEIFMWVVTNPDQPANWQRI